MSSQELSETLKLLQLFAALEREVRTSSGQRTSSLASTQRLKEYVMVAAIDFGTTFSGYAFSFKSQKDVVRMNKNWGAGLGFSSYKTPTCVLVAPDKTFKSFGYEAQQDYANLLENDDQRFYYFDRFKMKLHNNKTLSKTTLLDATNGKSLPALDVFSMSLEYLKDHLIGLVSQQTEGDASASLIRWVITVPAIWSDASKQFMREAAFKAGMTEDVDSNQLLIALEPEAASLYCRHLDVNQFVEKSRKTNINIGSGTKYLVVDAGGGTLDVTAHQILPDGRVKELHFATGGALGGTRVDEQFTNIMEDIFGKSFIDKYRKECASQWLQILSDFEKKKRAAQMEEGSSTNIQLLWGFGSAFTSFYKGKSVESAFKQYKGSGVRFASGMVCLSQEVMRKLFKPVTEGIVKHLHDLLNIPNLRDVSYFFLVGGFSESSRVQEVIFENFGRKVKILIPEESSLAVIKGAVQFGHDPGTICSRISSKTYGIETWQDFDDSVHPSSKKVEIEGRVKCKDLFRVFVKKDEEVEDGYSKSLSFKPVRENQSAGDVDIYSVDRASVNFVTDPGVEHHGKITIDWPGSGLDRTLEVSMTFGGTEIHVEAISYPGGNKTHTKIDFLTK